MGRYLSIALNRDSQREVFGGFLTVFLLCCDWVVSSSPKWSKSLVGSLADLFCCGNT